MILMIHKQVHRDKEDMIEIIKCFISGTQRDTNASIKETDDKLARQAELN